MTRWTLADAPDQTGKIAIITGANSGIGFSAAKMLAAKNATVVLACRNAGKGEDAARAIRLELPSADARVMPLDLSSLASVRSFATQVLERFAQVDLLINNAGVMALPFGKTVDGFETQFGTNHLGHFALTAQLWPAVDRAPQGRVVVVASTAHRWGTVRFDNLNGEKSYRKWLAYGQSKLANLLFAFELERRLRAAKRRAIALACHPGYARTNLMLEGPRLEKSWLGTAVMKLGERTLAQSPDQGAWPTLYAATHPDVEGGQYIGPGGPFQLRGTPTVVASSAASRDPEVAARLWAVSEQLTGTSFQLA